MFRLVGDPGAACKKQIERWAKGRAELEYGSYIPAQHFHTIPGFEVAPVAYTSDIPLLGRWGTPLLFGPGSIHVAHTPDEFIDVNELRAAVDAYERIVRSLLAHMSAFPIWPDPQAHRRRARRHRRGRAVVHPPAREPSVVRAHRSRRVRALGRKAVRRGGAVDRRRRDAGRRSRA